MLDALKHLYNFYDEFYTLVEEGYVVGQVLTDNFQKAHSALEDAAIAIIGERFIHAQLEDPEGLTKPVLEI